MNRLRAAVALVCVSVLAGVLVMPAPASAQMGLYATLSGAKVFAEDNEGTTPNVRLDFEHTNEWAVAGAVGYGFGIPLRVEGEFTYVTMDIDEVLANGRPSPTTGFHDHYLLMASAYYDLKLAERWTAFAGGGLGASHDDREATFTDLRGRRRTEEDHGWHFAYQLKGGLAYMLTTNLDLTAAYRYVRTQEREFGNLKLDEAALHFVELGVRYRFGR
jgi:opacity protein-like surface antigen